MEKVRMNKSHLFVVQFNSGRAKAVYLNDTRVSGVNPTGFKDQVVILDVDIPNHEIESAIN